MRRYGRGLEVTLLRGQEADRYLANPDLNRPVVLLFGPDSGRVTERAADLTQLLVGRDPLAVSRFDEADLASDGGGLAAEVYAPSLFSQRRVVRVRVGGPKSVAADLKVILDTPPESTWIVLEAGDLRKTASIRRLCEASPRAAAIGCYSDNDNSLGQLIDDEVATAGLAIHADARATLVSLLGADRGASRGEIQKLCLYAAGSETITASHVVAAVGDGAAFAIDDVVEAVALGDPATADRGFRRLIAAGIVASTIGTAAERHFLLLHRLRAAVDDGRRAHAVFQDLRPPILASRRVSIERQVQLWPHARLAEALQRLGQAIADSRLYPSIATAVIAQTLAGLAARGQGIVQRRQA